MELTAWLSLVAVCILGAMSPGPSIALVIKITVDGGRKQGLIAAVGHGLGIGCYALLAAAGIAILIQQSPLLFSSLKLLGACFLAYLGFKALGFKLRTTHSTNQADTESPAISQREISSSNSFVVGFLTAALNPKVALFLLALFSQFVSEQAALLEKLIMATTMATIDTAWYLLVAVLASSRHMTRHFEGYGKWLEKGFGLLLIAIAARIAFSY
jgi:threonine/homoserine/homoserine lactone efflux protein